VFNQSADVPAALLILNALAVCKQKPVWTSYCC
jgi:hypothetical protein